MSYGGDVHEPGERRAQSVAVTVKRRGRSLGNSQEILRFRVLCGLPDRRSMVCTRKAIDKHNPREKLKME